MSICEGSVNDSSFPLIINKVIVPNHNDKERLAFLSETNYKALISSKKEVEKSFDKKFEKMKADYINEVRMRKHDMRPHLRQLASSERLMLHYIDNINNLEELKKAMKKQIVSSHDALESISELVDHLSDEERFGEPERVNLNKFFEDLEINHNDNDCFTLETSCEEAISQIRGESLAEIVEHAQAKGISLEQFVKQYNADTNALYVNIAPVDLNRLVNNIVENARRHGFTDKCRNDYYFSVNVKINNQRNMYQIDFCNNGNPLPVGMTKDRYGLKGEKAGANAGTGSGGYIVRSIVEHYGGDYDVFTKDGITTIRIYLPKSSVE
jgi:signal transduction histidine kinase